jgi:RNA-directed DNA polymerase
MARRRQSDLTDLWRSIEQAGGVRPYVEAQLVERGFVVQRRETDKMSDREKDVYKKSLKLEAEERRKLARQAWDAHKATHIVHLGDGIFWTDGRGLDKWDLPDAEARAAENELPPLDSAQQLAEALGLTIPELRHLTYHRDVASSIHYVRFAIPKRDGSERAIWAPLPRLKEAQRWVLRNIAEKLLVHGSVHGFLAGRSTLTNAASHPDPDLVVKVDLKDFFPTITFPRVKGVFRKAGYREEVATLLALLCTESPREVVEQDGKTYFVALGPRCLPQGAPTSPALTNTLGLRLDRRLSGLARKLGWRYTRYADDLTFSLPAGHKGPPRVGTLLGSIRRIVEGEGFQVHPDKTAVARNGGRQRITGLVVNGDGPPRVPRDFKRRLRAAIHNRTRGKPTPEGESLSTLIGWAAYIHMTDPAAGEKYLAELTRLDEIGAGINPVSSAETEVAGPKDGSRE